MVNFPKPAIAFKWNGSMSREKGTTPWWMTKLKIENFS